MTDLLWIGVAVATIAVIVFITGRRWARIKGPMLLPVPAVVELQKPGIIEEQMQADRWRREFAVMVSQAGKELQKNGDAASQSALAALSAVTAAEKELGGVTFDVALNALSSGDIQSALVKLPAATVYVLVFPWRCEHSRLLRRNELFVDGWLGHLHALRQNLARQKCPEELLCLLYFLSPNGRDGVAMLAYGGDAADLIPEDLLDDEQVNGDAGRGGRNVCRHEGRYPFSLSSARR